MTDTKLVLKCGDIEVQCEGTEEFIKKELPKLIESVAQLRREKPAMEDKPKLGGAGHQRSGKGAAAKMSVSTLAQKLSVKKGPDLLMAAALSWSLGGTDAFTKQQLRDRCREAATFWKKSYANNFDNYVSRLVNWGMLNHVGGTNYALPGDQKEQLLNRLK